MGDIHRIPKRKDMWFIIKESNRQEKHDLWNKKQQMKARFPSMKKAINEVPKGIVPGLS